MDAHTCRLGAAAPPPQDLLEALHLLRQQAVELQKQVGAQRWRLDNRQPPACLFGGATPSCWRHMLLLLLPDAWLCTAGNVELLLREHVMADVASRMGAPITAGAPLEAAVLAQTAAAPEAA